tara:strand:+ start:1165 stop:1380 length:216 start_codon:yes stop_codon:yes gene_type:complete
MLDFTKTKTIKAHQVWPGMILIGLEARGRVQDIEHQKDNPDGSRWRKLVFADGFEPTSFNDETIIVILDEF